MPLPPDLYRNLPAAARQKLEDTDLTPAALRGRFGPRLNLDAEDESNPYAPPPQTDLGRRLVAHAQRCERTWLGIHTAHARSLADKSVDPTTAFLRSAQSAKGHLSDIDIEANALMAEAEQRGQWLRERMRDARKPPTSVGDAQIDAEVRALIRAEKDPVKAADLAKAHPRAVATAPAVALGWSSEAPAYREAIEAHLRAVAPEIVAERDELSDAVEQFSRADKNLSELTRSIIDFDLADKLHKGGQWDQAA
jgi:hypothetical protein